MTKKNIKSEKNKLGKYSKLYQENFWGVLQYRPKSLKSVKTIVNFNLKKKKYKNNQKIIKNNKITAINDLNLINFLRFLSESKINNLAFLKFSKNFEIKIFFNHFLNNYFKDIFLYYLFYKPKSYKLKENIFNDPRLKKLKIKPKRKFMFNSNEYQKKSFINFYKNLFFDISVENLNEKKKKISKLKYKFRKSQFLYLLNKVTSHIRRRKKKKQVSFFKINKKAPPRKKKMVTLNAKLYINKQKIKKFYGNISEKQFKNICKKILEKKKNLLENFLLLLESRLDTLIYRTNFVNSIFQAKQYIKHCFVLLNGEIINFHNYSVNHNQIISFKKIIHNRIHKNFIKRYKKGKILFSFPVYLEISYKLFSILIARNPKFFDIPYTTEIYPSLALNYYY